MLKNFNLWKGRVEVESMTFSAGWIFANYRPFTLGGTWGAGKVQSGTNM
jgi:hypothetical protein